MTTAARTVNIPLLRKAVEWAEAEAAKPEIDCQWVQDAWITQPEDRALDLLEEMGVDVSGAPVVQVATHCGTAYCIAGWVAQAIEARYLTEREVDGVRLSVFAAEALGIPPEHANASEGTLFSGHNSIADVRRIAESLAGERL